MKSMGAILWPNTDEWSVEPMTIDPPHPNEVAVRLVASGMCHSDEGLLDPDSGFPRPMLGGHEGAGIVEDVGSAVTSLKVGNHVLTSFMPSCGQCPCCVSGLTHLCDRGQYLGAGIQIDGLDYRRRARGQDIAAFAFLGTFAPYTVGHEFSFVPIDRDLPLDVCCLVSCGVTTGWSAAVERAGVRPGQHVAIMGAGGVGTGAIQGARLAGAERIFAIDPLPFKREQALKFGATDVAASVEEAFEVIQEATHGRMCNSVVITVGTLDGSQLGGVLALLAKRGRAVLVSGTTNNQEPFNFALSQFVFFEKELVGTLYGGANPRTAIPKLVSLYTRGLLDLESMITARYPLAEVNRGYQDLRDGKNIRGVLDLTTG